MDTDVDDGDDDDCGGGGGITTGRAPGVGMAPAGGVPRGGTPTETGGGRMTAAGALGAVKLASGIRGAWNSARTAKRTIFNHKSSISSGFTVQRESKRPWRRYCFKDQVALYLRSVPKPDIIYRSKHFAITLRDAL